MNYRHAYHAGNFADVLKHAVLALVLRRLTVKPTPLRVIDTHAGIGRYDLASVEATKTGEWRLGIGRLIGPDAAPLPDEAGSLLAPYIDAVRAINSPGQLESYPGSPLLALHLMRDDDRLVANELHPEDTVLLKGSLRGDPRAKVLSMDGWQALRALLPPKERRGVVLIDPPFEEAGELERLTLGLRDGLRRFATGVYVLWLPVKSPQQIASFKSALRGLALPKVMWVELHTEEVLAAERLVGTALAIVNPPFGLDDQLSTLLPFLIERLATGPDAGFELSALSS